ncbi:hypothetical protein ADUPG1_009347, partial [Aduncisulcus paluster]
VARMRLNPRLPFLATASSDAVVRIHNIKILVKPSLVKEVSAHTQEITEQALVRIPTIGGSHPMLLSVAKDAYLTVTDTLTLERVSQVCCDSQLFSLTVNDTGDIAYVGGSTYEILAVSLTPQDESLGCILSRFRGHSGKVQSLCASRDVLFSTSDDFSVRAWRLYSAADLKQRGSLVRKVDPTTGKAMMQPASDVPGECIGEFELHESIVTDIAVSEDGEFLATVSNDHSLSIWKIKRKIGKSRGKVTLSLVWSKDNAHTSTITKVMFGKGESSHFLYTVGWDREVYVWLAKQPKGKIEPYHAFPYVDKGHRTTAISLSPNGCLLIQGTSGGLCTVWNSVAPFALLCVCAREEEQITACACGENIFGIGTECGSFSVWPLVGATTRKELFRGPTPKEIESFEKGEVPF